MILVVGATGLVGGEVCRQLTAAGMPVRALIRPTAKPAKIDGLRSLGVDTIVGDLRDTRSLGTACRDVDAIVSTVSSMPFSYEPHVNDIATVDTDGMRALIDIATKEGVKRFVYTSFSGHIDIPSPLVHAKRTIEGVLMASRLDWTILRPSYFMEVWLTPAVGFDAEHGKVVLFGTGKSPISFISTRDVAAFATTALLSASTSRATLELGGPEAISPLDVVTTYEEALGHKIGVTLVPESDLQAQQASATDPMAQSFAALQRCYARGDSIDMRRTSSLLMRSMRTVREQARSMGRQPVTTG
ncbi:MAG: SDR family oxidoreductase [Candidatus Limnocylindrales bacterium]